MPKKDTTEKSLEIKEEATGEALEILASIISRELSKDES